MTKKKITTITVDDAASGMNTFWEDVERQGAEKITVLKDGHQIEISIKEAVMQKLAVSALTGSPQSIRQYNELQRTAAEIRQHEINQDVIFWKEVKKIQHKKYAAHNPAHGSDPLDFPHPGDIIIDTRNGVRIIGPINHDAYIEMRQMQRVIDACLWQDALDRRIAGWSLDDGPQSGMLLMALILSDTLPAREQMKGSDMVTRMMRQYAMTKRQLLKEVRQAWLEAGYVVKRGTTSRPMDEIKLRIATIFELLQVCHDPDIDDDARKHAIDALVYEQYG